jgi:hypothetical protein
MLGVVNSKPLGTNMMLCRALRRWAKARVKEVIWPNAYTKQVDELGSVRSIAMWDQQAIRYITPGLFAASRLA